MQFLTPDECRVWTHGRDPGPETEPTFGGVEPAMGKLGCDYGTALGLAWLFEADTEVLLWITLTRVWHANLHLYYRFRESYGDRRLVEHAPGHLFLHYERADLLSYVQIAVQCGWDFWMLGAENYARVFVSHDEYFLATASDAETLARLVSPP